MDIQSGKEILTFGEDEWGVISVAITPDGKYIMSACGENTITLWDIHSSTLHLSFVSFNDNEWLVWKPNGNYNCFDGAYKYFCFMDDSKGMSEIVDLSHPVYKNKKKEKLV